MTADLDFNGVRHSYRRLKERAEAVRRSRWRRAQDLCEAAGLNKGSFAGEGEILLISTEK